jgi:DNA-directed RNA polymerase II subunit RPB4
MGTEDEQPVARPRPTTAPIFRAPKQVSRPKQVVAADEEIGTELRLGEFENVVALSVSEARTIISAVHNARRKKDPATNPLGGDKIHNDSE